MSQAVAFWAVANGEECKDVLQLAEGNILFDKLDTFLLESEESEVRSPGWCRFFRDHFL
jgi:hypothetical protein